METWNLYVTSDVARPLSLED